MESCRLDRIKKGDNQQHWQNRGNRALEICIRTIRIDAEKALLPFGDLSIELARYDCAQHCGEHALCPKIARDRELIIKIGIVIINPLRILWVLHVLEH